MFDPRLQEFAQFLRTADRSVIEDMFVRLCGGSRPLHKQTIVYDQTAGFKWGNVSVLDPVVPDPNPTPTPTPPPIPGPITPPTTVVIPRSLFNVLVEVAGVYPARSSYYYTHGYIGPSTPPPDSEQFDMWFVPPIP